MSFLWSFPISYTDTRAQGIPPNYIFPPCAWISTDSLFCIFNTETYPKYRNPITLHAAKSCYCPTIFSNTCNAKINSFLCIYTHLPHDSPLSFSHSSISCMSLTKLHVHKSGIPCKNIYDRSSVTKVEAPIRWLWMFKVRI